MKKGYPISLSPEQLLARSRELTGIDIIDTAVIEPLSVLHRSLCEDGMLHAEGAVAQQNKLLRLLNNRLRMLRDFAAHPEIAEQKIERPVFAIGLGRSGTTKTQKVLAASGDFNFLPFWKAYNPASFSGAPNESTEMRIAEAEEYCRWFDAASPETKQGHSFETHEPEEDTTLTEISFIAPSFIGWSGCAGYMEWLAQQNPLPLFEALRDIMKYLQWQGLASADKRWLLKAPTYYGFEAVIFHVFPDADFVMTHRSPLQTVPSSFKLIELFRIPFSTAPVEKALLCEGFASMLNQHIANRAALSQLRILDLHFDEVTRSMDTAVEKIYAHIDEPLTDTARANIRAWGERNPQHKNGGFKYSLEEFGLDAAAIKREMANYFDLIARLFP